MAFTLPNTIVNDTTRDARPIQANFTAIETALNGTFLLADGTVQITSPLTCDPAPTAPGHLANKAYVDQSVIPVGVIMPYGGLVTPGADWAFCQGQLVSKADNPGLWALFGDSFGTSTGTQFYVPDLRDRVPVGKGTASYATTLGAKGGSKDAVAVSHTHTDQGHTHTSTDLTRQNSGTLQAATTTSGARSTFATTNLYYGETTVSGPGYASLTSGGVAGTDKNLQPYIVLNYIVRLG